MDWKNVMQFNKFAAVDALAPVTTTPAVTTPCAGDVVQAPVLSCYVNCSFDKVHF